ncbi:MAG: PrsW family intramembrane metalloprotease [Clostridiaceae bacterium]|nr:PrsW family intramembrane metalloprotease [Clostridiaceae bacterium]
MYLLALAIAPSIAILVFIYTKDKYDKEPLKFLLLLFGLGCLTVIPACILELVIQGFAGFNESLPSVLVEAFLGVALIEEGVKYFVLRLAAGKRCRHFNQMYDGIVYAVYVSLGFATVENILYVFQGGLTTGIMRALTAVPCHAITAVAMGYYLGIGRFRVDSRDRKKYMALSFIVPVILHGIYDFLVLSGNTILILIFIPFVIFMYIFAFKKIKRLAAHNHMVRDEETGRITDLS